MKIRKAHKAYSNRMWKRLMQKRWEKEPDWLRSLLSPRQEGKA